MLNSEIESLYSYHYSYSFSSFVIVPTQNEVSRGCMTYLELSFIDIVVKHPKVNLSFIT